MKKQRYQFSLLVILMLISSFKISAENIAIGKTITPTSTSTGHPISMAIDNNASTYWQAGTYVGTVSVDLAGIYLVTNLNVQFYNTASYRIEGSGDGVNFTTIVTKSGLTNATQVQNNSMIPTEYTQIRIVITSVLSSNYCGVAEIDIEGTLVVLSYTDRIQSSPSKPLIINTSNNVGIGTTNPGSYKLAVEGKIGAREVNVLTGPWPDYVFNSNYYLMPLNEVETFIKSNKHLPNVPDACDVEKDGINLGEMNAILMKKIEELTLYMIELKKENDSIKAQMKNCLNKN
jgi:hypothetical protein